MPTIKEVAERAGVSPTTVSHVINNTRVVSDEVRKRVQMAMDELGYRPNALARSLRRGETRTLGLILPDSANPFFAEISRAIETSAFGLGYSVILCNTEGDADKEGLYLDVLTQRQVDGIIFVASGDRSESLGELLRRRLPSVVVDRELPHLEVDTVLADNLEGGRLAAQHLIGLGHRRIGCISGPSDLTPSAQRVTGYRRALHDAGLTVDEALIRPGNFHLESGRAGAQALLALADPPTALFACNDLMAMGVLRAAHEGGRSVPQDLAVVGFDDIDLASYTSPPLTSVAQPTQAMGERAVRLLIERIARRDLPTRKETLPTRLTVRASCGARA